MRTLLVLAAALAAVATPAAAHRAVDAASNPPPSVRVSYADLNLATDAGMARFHRRLAGAVKRVCPREDGLNLQRIAAHRRCVATAKARLDVDVAAAAKAQAIALAARGVNASTGQ